MSKDSTPIDRIVIPEVNVYWSGARHGEVDVKIREGGNSAAQALGRMILGSRMDSLEDGFNSDIRGRGTGWQESERRSDITRTDERSSGSHKTGTLAGELFTEEGIIVAKGGGKISVSGEYGTENGSRSATENGAGSTYRQEQVRLSDKDMAAYRVEAKGRALDEMAAWVKENPRGATLKVGDKAYYVGPEVVNAAIAQGRGELAREFLQTVKAGVTEQGARVMKGVLDGRQWLQDAVEPGLRPILDTRDTVQDAARRMLKPLLDKVSVDGGYDNPANPYARMYAANLDAVTRDPGLRGNASPQDVASALTFAASQQRIDPAATLTLRASADGAVHGMVAGGVDPAASRLRVDPANLVLPTQEQLAQAPLPATQDDPARQARMSVG